MFGLVLTLEEHQQNMNTKHILICVGLFVLHMYTSVCYYLHILYLLNADVRF